MIFISFVSRMATSSWNGPSPIYNIGIQGVEFSPTFPVFAFSPDLSTRWCLAHAMNKLRAAGILKYCTEYVAHTEFLDSGWSAVDGFTLGGVANLICSYWWARLANTPTCTPRVMADTHACVCNAIRVLKDCLLFGAPRNISLLCGVALGFIL